MHQEQLIRQSKDLQALPILVSLNIMTLMMTYQGSRKQIEKSKKTRISVVKVSL